MPPVSVRSASVLLVPALVVTSWLVDTSGFDAAGVDTSSPGRAADQSLAVRADLVAAAIEADRIRQGRELSVARAITQQRARTRVVDARQQAERDVVEAGAVEAARREAERAAVERAERAVAEQAAAPGSAAPGPPGPQDLSPQAPARREPVSVPVPAAPRAAAAAISAGSSYSSEVLRLVNIERSRAGVPAVSSSSCAASWATRWSQRMADTGEFSHQPLEPVLQDCGASGVGENIGFGNSTPAEMMQLWMDSQGHRENILRPQFTHLGVGAVQRSDGRWYLTQDFLTL